MNVSMVKCAMAGNLIAEWIKKAIEWANQWAIEAAYHAAHTDKMGIVDGCLYRALLGGGWFDLYAFSIGLSTLSPSMAATLQRFRIGGDEFRSDSRRWRSNATDTCNAVAFIEKGSRCGRKVDERAAAKGKRTRLWKAIESDSQLQIRWQAPAVRSRS